MTKAEYAILSTRESWTSPALVPDRVRPRYVRSPTLDQEQQPECDTTGPPPEPTVTPEGAWFPRSEVAKELPP